MADGTLILEVMRLREAELERRIQERIDALSAPTNEQIRQIVSEEMAAFQTAVVEPISEPEPEPEAIEEAAEAVEEAAEAVEDAAEAVEEAAEEIADSLEEEEQILEEEVREQEPESAPPMPEEGEEETVPRRGHFWFRSPFESGSRR